jgi:hypothetical protein
MSARRRDICHFCGTGIARYGPPWNLWVHTEIELEHTLGHEARPFKERAKQPGKASLQFARSA